MTKMLMVGKFYFPYLGGIESNLRYVAEHAAERHKVVVLAFNHLSPRNTVEIINDVLVFRRGFRWSLKGQPICLGLFKGIRLTDYDVIHLHAPNPLASALLFWKRLIAPRRVPLVVTHHMDMAGPPALRLLALPFVRHTLNVAANVIVTSWRNRDHSRDLPQGRACVAIPLGLDPRMYAVDDGLRREAVAWRRVICGDAPMIGFCGRLARYKGVSVLIRALADLPDARAVIGGEGPELERAQALARELGVADRAIFLGRLSHRTKLRLLAAVDCFAFPSTEPTEAFGLALLEAMACGAPVVASDLPTGVSDIAMGERTAIVVPPRDPQALALAIRRLLDDPKLARTLASAGQDHVLRNMNLTRSAAQTLCVLEEAAGARWSPRARPAPWQVPRSAVELRSSGLAVRPAVAGEIGGESRAMSGALR